MSNEPTAGPSIQETAEEESQSQELSSADNSVSYGSFDIDESLLFDPDPQQPKRTLLPYNRPEKIILVVDTALDAIGPVDERRKSLELLNLAVKAFLTNKSSIDAQHEYALVVLNESTAGWVVDFTNKIDTIIMILDGLKPCIPSDICELTSVFDLINTNVKLPPAQEDPTIPPEYIVRTILMFTRCNTLPVLIKSDTVDSLLSSQFFTFDVLMLYNAEMKDAYCQSIEKILKDIDPRDYSYFFSVAKTKVPELLVAMTKFLSHPLQRPPRNQAYYSLK